MDYHEPWVAIEPHRPAPERRAEPAIPYEEPLPKQPWYIWTREGVDPPTEVLSVLSPGELIPIPGRRIVCFVTNHCSPKVPHGEMATRIAACVNAMRDIDDPETWAQRVRRYLRARRESGDKDAASLCP